MRLVWWMLNEFSFILFHLFAAQWEGSSNQNGEMKEQMGRRPPTIDEINWVYGRWPRRPLTSFQFNPSFLSRSRRRKDWISLKSLPRSRSCLVLHLCCSLRFLSSISLIIQLKERAAEHHCVHYEMICWIWIAFLSSSAPLGGAIGAAAPITHPQSRRRKAIHSTPAAIVHSLHSNKIKILFSFRFILNMAGAPTSSTNQSNQLFSFSKRKDWIWFGVVDGVARYIGPISSRLTNQQSIDFTNSIHYIHSIVQSNWLLLKVSPR